ncbi:Predicted lactoylglutathione lyase [Thermoflavimicrobium dichotomicum]|uniref:Predicted lactoylglutathione lyase n=1 Tax=Thermoflavimicrobium dichotomicum TaxID=46223 RepID=A0A1I3U2V2_9BACL|nr:Predicted lactoylglutathione lyase [Thermoflavimicrobium dichotomicum]
MYQKIHREGIEVHRWVEPSGIYETHLHVRDLKKSVSFYQNQLGLKLCYSEPERKLAFFWVGQARQQMLGLWEKPEDQIVRSHFAFSVSLRDLELAPAFLAEQGIKYRDFFGNPGGEPTVHSWMPAASLYFEDPDGHSLEYIALLPEGPRPELGAIPLSRWRELHQQIDKK